MSLRKRLSVSSVRSVRSESPLVFAAAPNADAEDWTKTWQTVLVKDLIDSPVVVVDADTSVEDACEILLSKDILCLAIKHKPNESSYGSPYLGLFDFSDVNSFLTLAATRHRWGAEELKGNPRMEEIINAAKAGRVPVHLVSNLSEKNPLEILPHDATILNLLSIFSRGTHRALIQAPSPSTEHLGMVSDRGLLQWFTTHAQGTPSLQSFLSNSLSSLNLPSLYLYSSVVAAKASDTVLDAMKLMSEQGVSSIAVIEEENGVLLSAVSVTDIGKIVVPSESNHILSTPLHQFIAHIKEPDGMDDGADKYPVYSVLPSSTLLYTMQKLIATNAHRLFVTDESQNSPSSSYISIATGANLSGIVSIVDILSLFARIANLPDVDPTRMQRHRRASSTSSQSSRSPRQDFIIAATAGSPSHDFARSRSSSRTGYLRNSVSSISSVGSGTSSGEGFQWAERVPKP